MHQFESSIVRIFGANTTETVGCGILCGPRDVLTCTHVIQAALRMTGFSNQVPVDTVQIDFPLVAPGHLLNAKVQIWLPAKSNGEGDICLLHLDDDLPQGATAARLVASTHLWQLPFGAFGFPQGNPKGVWASGIIAGKIIGGRIQVEDTKATSYFIEPGFSGTGVWNDEYGGVVGMIVSDEQSPNIRAAFMIPIEILTEKTGLLLSERLTEPDLPVSERLYSNLLELSGFPPQIYVAPSTQNRWEDVVAALENAQMNKREWVFNNGNILSFHDLSLPEWSVVCDVNAVDTLESKEWAYSTDVNRRNEFADLLMKSLRSKVSPELIFRKDKGNKYLYFRASDDLKERKYHYQSMTNRAHRLVFSPYGEREDGTPRYFRHSAFIPQFLFLEGNWYLEITPTYHFTFNGYDRDKFYEGRLTGIKKLEDNQSVLGQVVMWAYYLTQPLTLFDEQPLLSFGSLMSFDVNFGFVESTWTGANADIDDNADGDGNNLPLFEGL